MIIHRDDKQVEEFEVELNKKSGKGSGLVLMGYKSGKGAYISEVVSLSFITKLFRTKHFEGKTIKIGCYFVSKPVFLFLNELKIFNVKFCSQYHINHLTMIHFSYFPWIKTPYRSFDGRKLALCTTSLIEHL